MDRAKFGPGGNEENFSKLYKSSLDAPEYLFKMGLDAYEYECARGINISSETAEKLGKNAKEFGIVLSVHAPYYINLSSAQEERIEKNLRYIINSCRIADIMGAGKVVVHCGGLSGLTREEAMKNTLFNLQYALSALESHKLDHIALCIETMGRINVLGDLDEVITICQSDERLLPCIDFGHLNSRTYGALDNEEAFKSTLERLIDGIGFNRASNMHIHFSRIQYSNGGEVKHLTFDATDFGPDQHLIRFLADYKLCPTVICESAGTQARDALSLKKIYLEEVEKCSISNQ